MRLKIPVLLAIWLSGAFLVGVNPVHSQEFPARPIRIVVPNAPGVSQDIIIRMISPGMSKVIGRPVIIENKPGAEGAVGYEYLARQAAPDGYTLVIAANSQLAILPLIQANLNFNPFKDLTPVAGLAKARYVFATSAKLPFKSFSEVVEYAKANPGKLNYGTSGATTRFVTEAIARSSGMALTMVPYKAGAAYQQAMAQNEVQVGLQTETSSLVLADKIKVLAVTGEARIATFPNVPTLAELGYPNMPGTSYELYAPAGVSRLVVTKLHGAAQQAVEDPDVKARTAKIGFYVNAETPEAVGERLVEESRLFAAIAKAVGIKAE